MEIITSRCLIRPFFESDISDFMAYRNDMDWMRFQGFKGLTREEYREALLSETDEARGVQLAVIHRETDRLIGDLYYRVDGDTCWIGYTITPDSAQQGYAAEATQALLQRCACRGFHRALADVSPGNAASLALLHKLGFRYIERTADDDLLFALPLIESSERV